MDRLISDRWDNQQFVPKARGFIGKEFVKGIGIIQGNPASTMIFNIVVDAVVRAVLEVVCGPQEAQHGMGWSEGEQNLVLYADDGQILGRDHIWVQDALAVTVVIFKRVGIETNMEKKSSLVCTPGYIRGKWI